MDSPTFFVTYWQLSICDLICPQQSYSNESKKISERAKDKSQDKSAAAQAVTELGQEMKAQLKNVDEVSKRLIRQKDHWFESPGDDVIDQSRQNARIAVYTCFLPRAKLSPMDALYAAKFTRRLHTMGTPNFSTLSAYEFVRDRNRSLHKAHETLDRLRFAPKYARCRIQRRDQELCQILH